MSAKVQFQFHGVLSVCHMAMAGILNYNNFPESHVYEFDKQYGVYQRSIETSTECFTSAPNTTISGPQNVTSVTTQNTANAPSSTANNNSSIGSAVTAVPLDIASSNAATKLYALVQHIYAAQARVQLEVNEIKRAQSVANSAQKSLEEAANNVRAITAALQSAQQEVAAAAVRAQTAQMQLAAHDQLLFAARQKVDALSSQMVGLQAEDGVGTPKNFINIQALLSQLKEPLPQSQTPTPVPSIDKALNEEIETGGEEKDPESNGLLEYDELYNEWTN